MVFGSKKLIAVIALLSFAFVANVFAQEATSEVGGGSGLTISPVIVEPKIQPGDTYNQLVKLENPLDKSVVLYPMVANFTAKDNSGEPIFATSEEDNSYGLASWIKFSTEEITIAPKSRTEFSYSIEVPTGSDLGGYYGAMLFSTQPGSLEGSGVAVSSQLGQLILLSFGESRESLKITKFEIPTMVNQLPIEILTTLNNDGNVHVKATGVIKIKNMFGKDIQEITFNEDRNSVLPQQNRNYTYNFEKEGAFGYYTASLELTYGEAATGLTAEAGFWVLPIIPILIVIVIIVLIIIFIRSILKRHDNKILNQNNQATTTQNTPPSNPPVV